MYIYTHTYIYIYRKVLSIDPEMHSEYDSNEAPTFNQYNIIYYCIIL